VEACENPISKEPSKSTLSRYRRSPKYFSKYLGSRPAFIGVLPCVSRSQKRRTDTSPLPEPSKLRWSSPVRARGAKLFPESLSAMTGMRFLNWSKAEPPSYTGSPESFFSGESGFFFFLEEDSSPSLRFRVLDPAPPPNRISVFAPFFFLQPPANVRYKEEINPPHRRRLIINSPTGSRVGSPSVIHE